VSALAHWLEEEGIATTLVALTRVHAEKMSPPRCLWVPFELGRPLGPANEPAFQRRVLEAALGLLDSATEPGRIVDCPDEDPRAQADPGWQAPIEPDAADLGSEVAQLRPAFEAIRQRSGRTTVGLTDLEVPVIADYLGAYAEDEKTARPRSGLSPASLMRFCIDDLKAYYLEAATAGPGKPSSRQLTDWFWQHTVAARLIRHIRDQSAQSEDKQRRAVAEKSLIPGLYA